MPNLATLRPIEFRSSLSRMLIVVIGLTISQSACTTTTITPDHATALSRTYDTLVIRNFTASDDLAEIQLPYFKEGFLATLREENAFSTILESETDPVPDSGLAVRANLSELDEGDLALRFIIGFGAGRAKVHGQFGVTDSHDDVLLKFESHKSYAGGAGIGGFDMISTSDLVKELGQESAAAISRWSRGEPLNKPTEQ